MYQTQLVRTLKGKVNSNHHHQKRSLFCGQLITLFIEISVFGFIFEINFLMDLYVRLVKIKINQAEISTHKKRVINQKEKNKTKYFCS